MLNPFLPAQTHSSPPLQNKPQKETQAKLLSKHRKVRRRKTPKEAINTSSMHSHDLRFRRACVILINDSGVLPPTSGVQSLRWQANTRRGQLPNLAFPPAPLDGYFCLHVTISFLIICHAFGVRQLQVVK
jgi:hypothetical protein